MKQNYPEIDLNIEIKHKRKESEIIIDNDTADAVCIALFPNYDTKDYIRKHLVNYT